MYLIRSDGTYKPERFQPERIWKDETKKYAILSHTWAMRNEHEVSFADMQDLSSAKKKPGWSKIEETSKLAAKAKIPYFWIDTCCIDKSGSHDQIQTEIHSMYRYYEKAEVCYVLLSDVPGACPPLKTRDALKEKWGRSNRSWESRIREARWFYRGWTLQELIAPRRVEFYNCAWGWIGSLRGGLLHVVATTTKIPKTLLEKDSKTNLEDFTIAERMTWIANRKTTLAEDMAYALFGIFNVTIPTIPGEGWNAFERLQLAIIATSTDHSILAWQWQKGYQHQATKHILLAPRPKYFLSHAPVVPIRATRAETARHEHPFSMTNRGLQIRLPVISDASKHTGSKKRLALLNCCYLNSKGEKERIALLVKEVDDGKTKNKTPEYEVYFEPYGKKNDKGESEMTRLVSVRKGSANPPELKADLTVMLRNGYV